MPSTLPKRNAILLFLLATVSTASGCGQRLAFDVVLRTPSDPDPFADVRLLRVSADLDRGVQRLGEVRWDQGPVVLPRISNPAVQRIVVEGLNEQGVVISSGASGPLDLLQSPPDGVLTIDFSRVGAVSLWPEESDPRRGGRAVPLTDGRWIAVGGSGADGCPREDTQIFGPGREEVQVGPFLPGGRAGDFLVLPLGNDELLVTGGVSFEDCDTERAPIPYLLRPSDGLAFPGAALDWAPGAAIAALREDLVLAAGGWREDLARTEVFALDPQVFKAAPSSGGLAGANELLGTLSIPRAGGTLVALGPNRALVLGGQTRTSTDSALDDAAVFDATRGTSLDERIGLGEPLVGAPAQRTAAGSVIVLSPDLSASGFRSEVKAVTVKQARSAPLGDVTAVTVVTGTATSELMTLGDGSLLKLGPDGLDWIQLLPRQARPVENPSTMDETIEGPFIGGSLNDGRLMLLDPEGRHTTFNPGPAAVLGWRGPAGALVLAEGEPNLGIGLVPLRPARWRLTRDGLEGQQNADDVELGEWAVAIDRTWMDFDLTVDLRAQAGSEAMVLWGAEVDRFTYLAVGAAIQIGRFGSAPPTCDEGIGPARTDFAWATEVRVQRAGQRVTVRWPQGQLTCTFNARSGWLGLGVRRGTVTFRSVRVGLP